MSRRHNLGVHFYGRSGQEQYGLDIVERRLNHRRTLYQVKRYTIITPAQLRGRREIRRVGAPAGTHGTAPTV
ncbi:hypothetical protein [Embleya sp. NBC_00896]|uniref:hypothetical protein n=1 Tax=Embleya sp. NBC_00896 TaxID=2975961 RepID=UPI0038708CE3|nr:hypothetical protein OG928_00330 [Embleya sp. NBC_00896]